MSFKDAIKKSLYYGGWYRLTGLVKRPQEHRLLIVMYHDVRPDQSQGLPLSSLSEPDRNQFSAQVKALTDHFRVTSIEQAMEEIRNDGSLSQPTAAITFDDGYANVYHIAWPVLQSFGVPATIYLPTDWINGRMTFWWLRLAGLIESITLDPNTVKKIEDTVDLPVARIVAQHANPIDRKRSLLTEMEKVMRKKSAKDIEDVLSSLTQLNHAESSEDHSIRPLTWEQIKEMSGAGIQFGAHTVSHLNFRDASHEEAEHEIVHSKAAIENHLPGLVKGFAYPYGIDTERYLPLRSTLKRTGFIYAVTACPGVNNARSDPFLLSRITMPLSASSAILGRELMLGYRARR